MLKRTSPFRNNIMPKHLPGGSLLPGTSQFDVDFVVPRVGVDLPLGIDPFLLYKSRDPEYRALHDQLVTAFNDGIAAVRGGDMARARETLSFPEPSEVGLGYTASSKHGSGVGSHLTGLILDTLSASRELLERGVRHIEEMQLLSARIGPDRVSDIAVNVLKDYLIRYTQRQCDIWKIPTVAGVPVKHIYGVDHQGWTDGYFDLPVSPLDETPILLVPRRIVRALPWINYDDFLRTEFRAYLDSRRASTGKKPMATQSITGPNGVSNKAAIVSVTRSDIRLVERYVSAKEKAGGQAGPSTEYIDEDACEHGKVLKQRLAGLCPGRDDASAFQLVVLEILNHVFMPHLIDGDPEVRTVDGTERRDVLFTNDSDESFWSYARTEHSSIVLMFECKNTSELDMNALNQTATYLGDRVGRLGFVVSRAAPSDSIRRKAYAIWNDSGHTRKMILFLSDQDLIELVDLVCSNGSPTKWMQRHYRQFRTRVQ